jgi:hypothetical protein
LGIKSELLESLNLREPGLPLSVPFFQADNFMIGWPTDDYGPRYVGSEVCKPCHEKEYSSFVLYAKKSKSYQSIVRLEKGLSAEDLTKCYGCHTTGYGRPGGFTSIEETPDMKNAGCEVCHGPGGMHIKTEDSNSIKVKPTREDCETCHTSERVKAFRYTPLIHGGGH